MAHQIVDEQIAWRGAVPWHGLGVRMDEDADPAAFLKAAKLDWTLERRELFTFNQADNLQPVKDRFAHVRNTDGKCLTIAGPHWRPLQNADAIDFMARYVKAGGARMETVGALRDGAVIWGLARLGHAFEVRPGDRTEGFLLFTSPHEVGTAITIRTTTVRVVCANTMAMAERGGKLHFAQNHLSDFDVAGAREAVAAAHEVLALAEKRARTLDALKLSAEEAMRRVILPVFEPELAADPDWLARPDLVSRMPKSAMAILKSIAEAPGAITDTAWGALNGVTHYCDHVAGRRADVRLADAWMGQNSRRKQAVEAGLLALAA